ALRQVLDLLRHGAGDVHEAEHDGIARRQRLLHEVVVAQVEVVEERYVVESPLQPVELVPDLARAIERCGWLAERFELLAQRLHLPLDRPGEGDAPGVCALQRLEHVQACRDADLRVATLLVAERLGFLELLLHEVGQLEILEYEIEELLARQLEDEVVHSFARVAGPAPAARAAARRRPLDAIAGHELLVTGQHAPLVPARAVAKHRLRNVLARDADLVAAIGVGDAPSVHRVGDRFLDVTAEAAHETLPVDGALVAALLAAIDDEEGHPGVSWPYRDLRTLRYHSDKSFTCFSVYPCSVMRRTKSRCFFWSSEEALGLNEITGSRRSE